MKILGLDTSTKFLCLGIYDNAKVYTYNLDLGRKHSVLLVPTIKRILDALGWRLNDIDYFACGLGPGSFTGMRVGVATIKGLAWALKKKIVGLPTLDVLARNAELNAGFVAPVIDAKRNLMYTCIYKIEKGRLRKLTPYLLLSLDDFLKKVKKDTLILGDALGLYRDKFLGSRKRLTLLDKDRWQIQPHHLLDLALEKIKAGQFSDSSKLEPIYLYPKECQIRKTK